MGDNDGAPQPPAILKDWQVLELLNELCQAPGLLADASEPPVAEVAQRCTALVSSQELVERECSALAPDLRHPLVQALLMLWPIARPAPAEPEEDPETREHG